MTEKSLDKGGKFSNKRNAFQIANDRLLALELLIQGKTYRHIAQHISSIRDYSLSHEQVRRDIGVIQEELIASTLTHALEAIAEELKLIKELSINVSSRLAQFQKGDKGAAPYLKLMADLAARRTYLAGGDTYVKAQDINQAMERVIRAGYEVRDPTGETETVSERVETWLN